MDPIKLALFMSRLHRMRRYRQKRQIQYPIYRYVTPISYSFEFDLN